LIKREAVNAICYIPLPYVFHGIPWEVSALLKINIQPIKNHLLGRPMQLRNILMSAEINHLWKMF
jgi:hypothetical protein